MSKDFLYPAAQLEAGRVAERFPHCRLRTLPDLDESLLRRFALAKSITVQVPD